MSKKTFTLEINEGKHDIINALLSAVHELDAARFHRHLEKFELVKDYDELLEEFILKSHELDWCKDETCDYDLSKSFEENVKISSK